MKCNKGTWITRLRMSMNGVGEMGLIPVFSMDDVKSQDEMAV